MLNLQLSKELAIVTEAAGAIKECGTLDTQYKRHLYFTLQIKNHFFDLQHFFLCPVSIANTQLILLCFLKCCCALTLRTAIDHISK